MSAFAWTASLSVVRVLGKTSLCPYLVRGYDCNGPCEITSRSHLSNVAIANLMLRAKMLLFDLSSKMRMNYG